jgi:hypothetical protein
VSVTAGEPPPLLVALAPEQARRRAAQAGWKIAHVIRTAPPARAPAGPLRVIGQKVTAPRALTLVVAAGSELACRCAASAAE